MAATGEKASARTGLIQSLRFKVFLGLFLLQVLIFTALGYLLFEVAASHYFKEFQARLLFAARTVAATIPPQAHAGMNSADSVKDPEYVRALELVKQIRKNERHITSIYTVNYDRQIDRFTYAVESTVFDHDVMWLESPVLGFRLWANDQGLIRIFYNSNEYSEGFVAHTPSGPVSVGMDQRSGRVTLDGKEAFRVTARRPLSATTTASVLNHEKRVGSARVLLRNAPVDFVLTFQKKGEPSSLPGDDYIADAKDLAVLKRVVRENQDLIEESPRLTNYGEALYGYAAIRDELGGIRGIVVAEVHTESLAAFQSSLRQTTVAVFSATVLITVLLSLILGRSLLQPIRILVNGVRDIASGNLETRVQLNRRDEFGGLATTVNHMVVNLKSARDEATALTNHLKSVLSSYDKFVPHAMLEQLGRESILDVQLGDSIEKEMTVLFNDIRSFTTLSEAMTPRETFEFINGYLGRVGPIIRKHGGFIDKYIGDAIMALFPANPDDALLAAVEMQNQVFLYNGKRVQRGLEPISIGVGLHMGKLILGTVGESERMEGTVIADAVNIAARLEGLTKSFGAGIIISASARSLLRSADHFQFRYLGKVQVKGKTQPVDVFEVLDGLEPAKLSRRLETRDRFEQAVALFYSGDLAASARLFRELQDPTGRDPGVQYYLERLAGEKLGGEESEPAAIQAFAAKEMKQVRPLD